MTKQELTTALARAGEACTQENMDQLRAMLNKLTAANKVASRLNVNQRGKQPDYIDTVERLKRNINGSRWLADMLLDTMTNSRTEINDILYSLKKEEEQSTIARQIAIEKDLRKIENEKYRKTKSNKED